MKIGQKIKAVRCHRNMTQKALGEAIGYPESSADIRIAQYEAGNRRPSSETLIDIAAVLQLSPAVFIGDCEPNDFYSVMQSLYWLEGGLDEALEVVEKICSELLRWEAMVSLVERGAATEEQGKDWILSWPERYKERYHKVEEEKDGTKMD